jgi:transcriptional regulator with XRE-family HTH domain
MEISEKMKKYRISLNLKANEAAQRIGVAESTYRDWENGRKIQGEPYQLIADALDISILELLGIETTKFNKIA